MNPSSTMRLMTCGLCALLWLADAHAQIQSDDFTRSFSPGREYFFLRSGNAKLVLQADRTGTRPAFLYMLFDADRPCQTLRKE
ncbi:MAG: hypothetical protein H6Q85_1991, partial [candidate division NC10 bacterium]|nr:hypothetical protein [candidate division NC10 bacterium]